MHSIYTLYRVYMYTSNHHRSSSVQVDMYIVLVYLVAILQSARIRDYEYYYDYYNCYTHC